MKLFKRSQSPGRRGYDVDHVKEIATEARKLAIFDRSTGLYAYWYLQLRATEELSRAQRHGKGVICLSIWGPTSIIADTLRERLHSALRDHDLAAYLNNGHFAVLLTETDISGAFVVLRRLLQGVDRSVTAGVAAFPADGATFEALLDCAKQRAGGGTEYRAMAA
jgi:GGDEF domain-containing protein